MTKDDTAAAIDAVWRIESPRLIAGLARFCRGDLQLAEDLAQDALLQALEKWPADGIPDNPGGWLMTTAKNRAIDQARRAQAFNRKADEIGRDLERRGAFESPDAAERIDNLIGDDLLRLIFTTCHPVLTIDSRVALTLRMLGGLKTEEIARAFIVPDSTIGQRISRAKKTLAENDVPFEVPAADELPERMASVLGVIYLIFNEGYAATSGDDWLRQDLCEDAMRLGRVLAGLTPREPEVHGLVALMELQASRSTARTAEDGTAILLLDQDRTTWDQLLIDRGLAALQAARKLSRGNPGPYELQAEIAACHATARQAGDTDWPRIAALYGALGALTASPVVELNRAVAVSMAQSPHAGLEILESIEDHPDLAGYHLLPTVRGDLLEKVGRKEEAAADFRRAAELTRNQRERAVLLERAAAAH